MVNPLYGYLALTCFRQDIISDLPLLLHACNELKSIFPGFLCRKGLEFTKKNPWMFPHCDGVLQREEVRVSSGLSCGSLASYWWIFLVRWVYVVHIFPLLFWCCLLLLDIFWFDFSQRLLLFSILLAILLLFGVFLLCPLLLFHIAGSMPCCSLPFSRKF